MAIESIDGATFRKLLMGGVRWVSFHRDLLNGLNVYPVPDGDTGTNMYMTLRGAVSSFRLAPDSTMAGITKAVSKGALFGARGNSGVILSQILAGFARHFRDRSMLTLADLAPAFENARQKIYQAVSDPKEGTILTVVRELAESLAGQSFPSGDLLDALQFIHQKAEITLRETRDLLPVLKENEVVDAGGQGLVYLLEGMLRAARYEDFRRKAITAPSAASAVKMEPLKYPYCMEFIIKGICHEAARQKLEALGDSLVCAQAGDMLKVHLHTDRPDEVRSLAAGLGEIVKEKLDDMERQHRSLLLDEYPLVYGDRMSSFTTLSTALAAVVTGDGLADVFAAAGAWVIEGGKTMNPCVEEILTLLERVPSDEIIVLPNNPNCIIVCEQAASFSGKKIRVVPTGDMVEGLIFLNYYDPSMAMDRLVERYEKARGAYLAVEICQAGRKAALDGHVLDKGDWMALSKGKVKSSAATLEELLGRLADIDEVRRSVMLTVIAGADGISDVPDVMELVKSHFPLELSHIYGGQPHYPLLLSFRAPEG